MAIVANRAGVGPFAIPDPSYVVPNRSNAGQPASSNYAGEIVFDSTAKNCVVNVGSPSAPYWAQYTYGSVVNQH